MRWQKPLIFWRPKSVANWGGSAASPSRARGAYARLPDPSCTPATRHAVTLKDYVAICMVHCVKEAVEAFDSPDPGLICGGSLEREPHRRSRALAEIAA